MDWGISAAWPSVSHSNLSLTPQPQSPKIPLVQQLLLNNEAVSTAIKEMSTNYGKAL